MENTERKGEILLKRHWAKIVIVVYILLRVNGVAWVAQALYVMGGLYCTGVLYEWRLARKKGKEIGKIPFYLPWICLFVMILAPAGWYLFHFSPHMPDGYYQASVLVRSDERSWDERAWETKTGIFRIKNYTDEYEANYKQGYVWFDRIYMDDDKTIVVDEQVEIREKYWIRDYETDQRYTARIPAFFPERYGITAGERIRSMGLLGGIVQRSFVTIVAAIGLRRSLKLRREEKHKRDA